MESPQARYENPQGHEFSSGKSPSRRGDGHGVSTSHRPHVAKPSTKRAARWAMLHLLRVPRGPHPPVCSSADIPRLMEGSEHSALDSPTYGSSYAPIHLKSPWFSVAPSRVQPVLSVSVFFQCCELKTHAHNTWSRLYKWQLLTFLLRSHADTGPSAVTMCQCLFRHMFNTPALIHCQR